MATQFDILRRQAEGAAQNAVHRVQGSLRKDTSLVGHAGRWAGRTLTQGEKAVRGAVKKARRPYPQPGETVPQPPRVVRPAADGYVRRSPVQPLHEAADYHRRQTRRAAGAAALVGALCAGVYLLSRLGVFAL